VGPSYEVNRLDCREFTHTVYIGGRARVARGTACRQPDATWRII
jgi:surface antigen